MSLSKHYKDMALAQKHVMRMENHGNNPYHSRHIDQFCSYADLVAECAKAEVIEMLPKLIEQYMKSPKWQVDVDESSLKRVQQKINSMLDGIFGKR